MTTASLPQFVSEHEHKSWLVWTARVISAIPVLMMAMSAMMKMTRSPDVLKMWVDTHGFSESVLMPIAILELACAVIYAIPRTAALGAILIAAYFGGAFASHVRIDDLAGGMTPLALAILAWGGLYLRDERVRALLPLRKFGTYAARRAYT